MNEVVIGNATIDDVSGAMSAIREISSVRIKDFATIKKFIESEKNTIFFLDNKLNSFMDNQVDCKYMWLDTGLSDYCGDPIMISLIRGYDGYVGHMIGNIDLLAENIKNYHRLSHDVAARKVLSFKEKYNKKKNTRENKSIEDEMTYLLMDPEDETNTEMAKLLAKLNICFDEANEIEVEEESIESIERPERFSAFEEKITVELLLEKMEKMQAYMDELVETIEALSSESQQKIQELQARNEEYKRALRQMHTFIASEESFDEEHDISSNNQGHYLLGKHGKILVVGGHELGINVMNGIAKTYGFDKKDFEFVDYDKAKSFTERIKREGRYSAVIFGACPHKTAGSAGYSSALEMFKQTEGMPFVADARSKSGKLKVTKESFREALADVCDSLRQRCA